MKGYSDEERICHECVGEHYLSSEIESKGRRGKCKFCGTVTRTYTLDQLSDRIEKVMLAHYERTSDQPPEGRYYGQHWYREGQTVSEILIDEFSIDNKAAGLIEEALRERYADHNGNSGGEETEFDWDAHYEIRGVSDHRWSMEWLNFEDTLRAEARFFSEKAMNTLRSIFDEIDQFTTWSGKGVLTTIGPGKEIDSLFRARVFQSRAKLLDALCAPDLLLGPPSWPHAMSGRMNARGISVFYGATEASVALAEVRPPVGSKVAVARFEVLRPLQLLDLRELSNVREMVSVFDPLYLEKMEKAMFLRSLAARMTVPVMPDDEAFDYLPTQAIADYLASQTNIIYDGIIYPSVQVAGEKINVVLFHKSALVAPVDIPAGTKVQASDEAYEEDGPYESYQVIELVPARKKKTAPDEAFEEVISPKWTPALRIDLHAMDVHHIKSVQYETELHTVSRRRIKERKTFKRIEWDI